MAEANADQLAKLVPPVVEAELMVYDPLNCALATPAKHRSISNIFCFKKFTDFVIL
jgi:hypothetical protein